MVALGLEWFTSRRLSKYKDELVRLQNVEIASANMATEEIRNENLKLQQKLAPRSLTQGQRDALRDRAKFFGTQHIDVIVVGSSLEVWNFEHDIVGPLSEAGWEVSTWNAAIGLHCAGVVIDIKKGSDGGVDHIAGELEIALRLAGIESARGHGFGDEPPSIAVGYAWNKKTMAAIRVYIGDKPQ